MKKIISLTKVLIKEYYQNLPIFDKSTKKFNKKSIFFWLIIFIFFGMGYVSYEIINFFKNIGQQQLFINIYFPILAMILAFQTILSCANIFFFAKDIKNILYMPIKPTELLISKMATLLCLLYGSEVVFAVMPITMYALLTGVNILFYFWAILILLIFPIFIACVITSILFIIMRFAKFFGNKEIFQVIITIILIATVFIVEYEITKNFFEIQSDQQVIEKSLNINNKFQTINKYLLIVNPTTKILINPSSFIAIIEFGKIIFFNIVGIIILLAIGNITYLEDILKNIVSLQKKEKAKKRLEIKKETKSKAVARAYITKEIKLLIRKPVFFMQCVFPVIILLITAIIITVSLLPVVKQAMQDDKIRQTIENLKFNTEILCDILIVLQVMFSISNISLTAISREGSNATFIKYIPIDLYKQFIYKNTPQFLLNLLISIIVIGLIVYIIPSISIVYLLLTFAISIFINLLNCYLMLIVDLRRPNLNWTTEEAVVKKSDNKIFQYALLIANVVLLFYLASIFKYINIVYAMLAELLIYAIIVVIIDRCVNKWRYKLFNKIQ